MKKLLFVLIILLFGCIPVLAEGPLVQTEAYLVPDIDYYEANVFCYIVVKNTGATPVGLDKASVQLLDKNGEILTEDDTYTMFPPVLSSGETGYIRQVFYDLDQRTARSAVSFAIDISSETEYLSDIQIVPSAFSYEQVPIYVGSFYPLITCTLTNNTEETLREVEYFCILRDQDGGILWMDSDYVLDVGIPAGGFIYAYCELSSDDYEKWTEDGRTVSQIEGFAFIEK